MNDYLSGKREGLLREEELSIPVKALRESCINAFCHRLYFKPGSSVGIAIYDDRVEIENSGMAQVTAQVAAQVLKLVSLIGDNEMPVKEIMQKLSLNHKDITARYAENIKPMRKSAAKDTHSISARRV